MDAALPTDTVVPEPAFDASGDRCIPMATLWHQTHTMGAKLQFRLKLREAVSIVLDKSCIPYCSAVCASGKHIGSVSRQVVYTFPQSEARRPIPDYNVGPGAYLPV